MSAYAVYRDSAGDPILVRSAVLYLDVLGFQNMSLGPDPQGALRRFLPALEFARERADAALPTPLQALTWFTDNVVVAWPLQPGVDDEMALGFAATAATYLQLGLAVNGFFARGGIAFGDVHMADHVAFGPALVRAVEIEQRIARMPRVVLDPDSVESNRRAVAYYAKGHAPQHTALAVDGADGQVFVNYLGFYCSEETDQNSLDYWLLRHRDQLEAARSLHPEGSREREKIEWLASYHNYWCTTGLGDQGRYAVTNASAHAFHLFAWP